MLIVYRNICSRYCLSMMVHIGEHLKQVVFVSGSLGPIDAPHLCGFHLDMGH